MTCNLNTHVVTQCSTCSLLPTGPKSLYHPLQEVTKRNTLLCLPDTAWPSRWCFGLWTCSCGQQWRSHRESVMTGSWTIASSYCVIMWDAVKKRLASAVRVNVVHSWRSATSRSNFGLKQPIVGSSMASSVSQGNTRQDNDTPKRTGNQITKLRRWTKKTKKTQANRPTDSFHINSIHANTNSPTTSAIKIYQK
jgi:hypothetical protein